MTVMLKGLDRCKYISEVIDNMNYLVWVKDVDDNLLFANRPAFEFFKHLNKDGVTKCPTDIQGHQENEIVKLKVDGKDRWLRYSSSPVFLNNNFPDGILIVASDITEEKEREIQVSKKIDEKIHQWEREKEEKLRKIEKNNREINNLLNIMKSDSIGAVL